MKYLINILINKHSSFFNSIFIISFVILLTNNNLNAQNELDVLNNWLQFSDAPNLLYHHLTGQTYNLHDLEANLAPIACVTDGIG